MRVAVLGEGYAGAVDSLVTGNLLAADACTALANRLQGYAGMAGDDSTAAEFAASYDEAAAEAIAALADLVGAFGSLGHLAHASLANHHAAEVASGGFDVTAPPTRADDSVGILVAVPPTSLGGDSPALPGPVNWVLDQLEGVVWPDADTDRLRDAAGTWRTAANSVAVLAGQCDGALYDLADEVSPEIPLAIATIQDLRARVEMLADQLAAVGGACETYADQVDAKRAEMLDLLTELAVELAAGAVIGGALSVLSAGLAAPAAGAAGSARLAWAARELKLIVDGLRVLTGGTASTLRPVSVTLRDARAYLSKLHAARIGARTERGSLRLGLTPRSGWLDAHERAGGHLISRHVGKIREQLLERLAREPKLAHASTFVDQHAAERILNKLLRRHQDEIEAWLAGPKSTKRLEDSMGFITGRTLSRDGTMTDVTGVRAFLVKDPTMPDGFRIHTAFPQP